MEKFYPNISYLNYKKLVGTYLKTDKYTVYEYYGNRTDYAYESIDLGKAIAFLNKIGKSVTLEEVLKFCEENRIQVKHYNRYNNTVKNSIRVTWNTGGASGGNCWDDTEPVYHESDVEAPSFYDSEDYISIIKKFCPSMLFDKAAVLSNLIYEGSYSENEYYGNYEDYSYQEIEITDLVDFINKNEL